MTKTTAHHISCKNEEIKHLLIPDFKYLDIRTVMDACYVNRSVAMCPCIYSFLAKERRRDIMT